MFICVFNPVTKTIAEISSPPNVQTCMHNVTHIPLAVCVSSDNGKEFEMIFIAIKVKLELEALVATPYPYTMECMSYSSEYMS